VPVTVKDSFDLAGYPTTGGSTLRRDAIATRDSFSAARLKAAGAIVLGKTNLPEFLLNYETDNHLAGRTNNPWDLARTCGGSSGGEAAAIASFCSAGGIGSDGGGSIRVPAHFCGIAGLKPTPGRSPATGHWPAIAHPGGLLGVGGPLARSVADLVALFETLAGHDPRDPFSVPLPLRPPALDGLRCGVIEQFNAVPVQPALREAVARAARLLESLAIPVEPFDTRPLGGAPNLWWFLFGQLPAQFTLEMIRGREHEIHWTGLEFLEPERGKQPPSSARTVEVLMERDRLRAETLVRMESTPLLLAPACGVTAFEHRRRRHHTPEKEISQFEAMMPLTVWNLLGFPALTLPMTVSGEGLPAGVQLIAAPWNEELLLEAGLRLEQARGPFPAPPLALAAASVDLASSTRFCA
jgi:Asp-tRNA(Asn)/Glu-tRNA(Gln) amidotransferase A subunit family amidase